MVLEKIDDKPPDTVTEFCPDCLNNGFEEPLKYWHDSRCPVCDNKTIVHCPRCGAHWKVRIEDE